MEKNVFLRLAEESYTTKHYNGKMIPREQFATLCEILRLAPTSVNAQAWHFFTAHTAEARAKLLPALQSQPRDGRERRRRLHGSDEADRRALRARS